MATWATECKNALKKVRDGEKRVKIFDGNRHVIYERRKDGIYRMVEPIKKAYGSAGNGMWSERFIQSLAEG